MQGRTRDVRFQLLRYQQMVSKIFIVSGMDLKEDIKQVLQKQEKLLKMVEGSVEPKIS